MINKDELIKLLVESREKYYTTGNTTLSDQEYDVLEDHFKKMDPDHPFFDRSRATPSTSWKTVDHKIFMGSLSKVHTEEEFLKFASKFVNETFTMQMKLDGLSISLNYEDSKFTQAITRGSREDGKEGEDISANVRLMEGFKEYVPGLESCSLRAEIVLTHENFKKINSTFSESDKYLNPRNAAAGISRRLDGKFCKYLCVIYYDIYDPLDRDSHDPLNEDEKILVLGKMGFNVPHQIKGTVSEMQGAYKYFCENRSTFPFDIDGVVVKVCSHEVQQREGVKNNRPKHQIAWKFDPPGAATPFIKEVWDVGRTGVVTPLGHLQPILIAGTTVTKATLHNIANIKKLNIGRGDLVMVVKSGDIIPVIQSVLKHVGEPIEIPTHCPCCNSLLLNNGTQLFCENDLCPRKIFNRIMNWIKVTKIETFGESLADVLNTTGKLNQISDIYNLKKEDISTLKGWGSDSADQIIDSINKTRSLDSVSFLSGIGIPGISNKTSSELLKVFGTIEELFEQTEEDIKQLKGFAEISANSVVTGLEKYKPEILSLLKIIEIKTGNEGSFSGLSFCFTGNMSHPRSFYQDIVKKLGGTNNSSVTKDLSFLVCNENQGSNKSRKAEKYGVKVITENEFLEKAGDIPLPETKPEPDLKIKSNSFFE